MNGLPKQGARQQAAQTGMTLLELLVVVAIIALGTVGVGLAVRDSGQNQLEQEAQRLSALLETARAQSQASGAAVHFVLTAQGFAWEGLPPESPGNPGLPTRWLSPNTTAMIVSASAQRLGPGSGIDTGVNTAGPASILLGPEPLIAPLAVRLQSLEGRERPSLWVSTDGVRAFRVGNPRSQNP
jgi:general secretion pathway protein H